ncbi:tyrosine-type recombinase/integrase [Gammaproteobacteria bacterium]|nr:tyrosine-type recombinase/integrase [Gammaproteobacteria bacterium]
MVLRHVKIHQSLAPIWEQLKGQKADIEDFRIYDLRHTFSSWLVMEGVPLYEASKLFRHVSIKMTERYAHLASDHLHQVVAGRGFSAHLRGVSTPF